MLPQSSVKLVKHFEHKHYLEYSPKYLESPEWPMAGADMATLEWLAANWDQ